MSKKVVIGMFSKRVKDSFGAYKTVKYDIYKIDKPRNICGKTSDGNWAVDYYVSSPFREGELQQQTEIFWRKKEAIDWINQVK